MSDDDDIKINLMQAEEENDRLNAEIEVLRLIADAILTEGRDLTESLQKWHIVAYKVIEFIEKK